MQRGDSRSWTADAGLLLALGFIAFVSDLILAWVGGLRWADSRFLLPAAGTFLALSWLAIAVASSTGALRRRLFPAGAMLMMLAAATLLWLERLAWRPADHRTGVAPWVAITIVLLIAPFALASLRPRWLAAATPCSFSAIRWRDWAAGG